METNDETWIAACAHRLQQRWRSVDPNDLEAVAREIAHQPELRDLEPVAAAARWLEPLPARFQ